MPRAPLDRRDPAEPPATRQSCHRASDVHASSFSPRSPSLPECASAPRYLAHPTGSARRVHSHSLRPPGTVRALPKPHRTHRERGVGPNTDPFFPSLPLKEVGLARRSAPKRTGAAKRRRRCSGTPCAFHTHPEHERAVRRAAIGPSKAVAGQAHQLVCGGWHWGGKRLVGGQGNTGKVAQGAGVQKP